MQNDKSKFKNKCFCILHCHFDFYILIFDLELLGFGIFLVVLVHIWGWDF